MTRYFKILVNGCSCHGGSATWSLPHDDLPSDWMPEIAQSDLEMCECGYHVVEIKDLLGWLKEDCQIFEVEIGVSHIDGDDKICCGKVRLLRQMAWSDSIARLFAADCAEHVLHLYEEKYPDEKRPRRAIEMARKFARGEASNDELAAAWDAARAAAWAAAQKWQAKRLLHYITEK
jgi:hypothetical protein